MINLDADNKVSINEQELLTGRSCIIGQSGSGKSYAIAVICESLCDNGLGFIIIDTEGEYFSLKEKFNLIWSTYSDEGDLDLRKVDFKRLARQVIKNNVPLIFDVSEAEDPRGEVGKICKALYDQATILRIPYLIIIEEADKFCPQRGVCVPEVEEISRRGRKRGLGLLVASQRPALINKAVLSQCNIQLIGRLTIDNDIDAVKSFIHNRVLLYKLPDLSAGEFVLSGLGEDFIFKFKKRVTSHKSSSPPIKKKEQPMIKEVLNNLGIMKPELITGNGVKPLISLSDARKKVIRLSRKKYLFFGKKEKITGINLIYEPLIELKVRLLKKKFLGKDSHTDYYLYFNNYMVVNNNFEFMYNLKPLKELSYNEVQVLIQLLYSHGLKTIKSITRGTKLSEERVRRAVINLTDKKLALNVGKRGRVNTYEVLRRIDVPRIKSMSQKKLRTSIKPEEKGKPSIDLSALNSIIKSINRKAEILESKTLYFPFYEITLRRGDRGRRLLINGVTGKVK